MKCSSENSLQISAAGMMISWHTRCSARELCMTARLHLRFDPLLKHMGVRVLHASCVEGRLARQGLFDKILAPLVNLRQKALSRDLPEGSAVHICTKAAARVHYSRDLPEGSAVHICTKAAARVHYTVGGTIPEVDGECHLIVSTHFDQ